MKRSNNCPVTEGSILQSVTSNSQVDQQSNLSAESWKIELDVFDDIDLPKKSLFQSVASLMSDNSIKKICVNFDLIKRIRKINFVNLFKSMLKRSGKINCICIKEQFQQCADISNVTNSNIHFHLNKPEFLDVFKSTTLELMLINRDQGEKLETQNKVLVKSTLRGTGCSKIKFIDGSEIAVHPNVNKQLNCKVKGRKRNDNSQRAGGSRSNSTENAGSLKLHILADGSTLSIDALAITAGTYSERDIFNNVIKKSSHATKESYLFVADRGYYSKDIVHALENTQHKYVLRIKKNSVFVINQAFDNKGNPIPELEGRTLSNKENQEIYKKYGIISCIVKHKKSTVPSCRVVVKYNKAGKQSDKYMLLATNLSITSVSAERIWLIYRLRWQIENEVIKVIKSYLGLCKINSGKLSINACNILASIIQHQILMDSYLRASHKLYKQEKAQGTAISLRNASNALQFILAQPIDQDRDANVTLMNVISITKAAKALNISNTIFNLGKVTLNSIKKIIEDRVDLFMSTCLKDQKIPKKKVVHLKDNRLIHIKAFAA